MHRTAIVTGAGSYLGMAICKRLMDEEPSHVRLTIVVTSRSFRGAIEAVRELQKYSTSHHLNREALIEFDYVLFDQTDIISVLSAAREIKKRYTQVDYLVFNSSHSQMGGIDYWQATKDVFTNPLKAFTVGTFKIQGKPRISNDGMSAVFEANVFSPWFLVQEIKPVLKRRSKLIWISTSISTPEFFDRDDLGIEKSLHSYESSKYELELLHAATYERLWKEDGIESWLLQPGVFKSSTFVPTLNIFMYFGMLMMFYICRWCGSPYHCIYPELASNAPVWLALKAEPERDDMGLKFGSGTTRSGKETLMRTQVDYDQTNVEEVYKYVESLRKVWKTRLAGQVVERVGY